MQSYMLLGAPVFYNDIRYNDPMDRSSEQNEAVFAFLDATVQLCSNFDADNESIKPMIFS
jgi:hypothetical protein